MSLFERLWTVARANANDWVRRQEDPETQVDRILQSMQGQLVMNRQAVAQTIAVQKRTERQIHQAQLMADQWYKRAQLAVTKGDEDLAREALSRHRAYLENAKTKQTQVASQQVLVKQMKQTMQALEIKLTESRSQKEILVARSRSAKASLQVNDLLDQTGSSETMRAFERLENQVHELEAQVEISAELNQANLVQRFETLSQTAEIDAALAEMKTQLGGSQILTTPETDRDLDAIRSHLSDV
jgi:phage shock protein A